VTTGTLTHAPEHEHEHEHDQTRSQQAGVLLLIVADAFFVASLIFTYFYLRGLNTDGGWIPKGGGTLSPADGWVIAGIVALSALAYGWGERKARAGDRGKMLTGTALAMLLLLADLGVQVWRMVTMPFSVGDGSYASTIMVMAGAHVFHLLLTAMLGVAVFNRTRRGLFSVGSRWHARVVGYWWSWVAISAVAIAFTTSFVH
jgi:heme/copper-type cytochrome/quinol oxidase subunit 3